MFDHVSAPGSSPRCAANSSAPTPKAIATFRTSASIAGRRRKRWVMYNGDVEASRVPPEWHGWLHYTTDTLPPAGGLPRKTWQKDHVPNLTGTDLAYRPPGSTRLPVGDKPKPPYEAWRPG